MGARTADRTPPVSPVEDTLRRVIVLLRILVWIWLLVLVAVILIRDEPGNRAVLISGVVLATVWTGVTVWAGRYAKRLGSPIFVVLDGAVVFLLAAGGLIAGTEDFFSAAYPESWLFVVAFATNLRWTMVAAVLIAFEHAALHIALDLPPIRTAGTLNFLVLGLVVGWAFDNIRLRERLRLEAQARLAEEREAAMRYEERVRLAQRLHDSVLQTLHAVQVAADEPGEVRYLARRQERELRRTIEELGSPHQRSFRAALLACRDEVEELCRGVRVVDVVRDDGELTQPLEAGLSAAREAMLNAGKHAGVDQVDLYSEITNGIAVIHVRDRGKGFEAEAGRRRGSGMSISMIDRVEQVGGQVEIESAPGQGTEVTISVPVS